MSEAIKKDRPQYRNINIFQLLNYRMPMAAIVSILHRISGVLMFLLLPFAIYLLEKSLTSEISFEHFKGILSAWPVKLVILGLVWGYLHHFCAGVRHLVMDTHVGLAKESARKSAVTVIAASLTLTALIGLKLFGAF